MITFTTYENKNTAEWVTFVHGAGGSSSIWFKQIKEFKAHFNILLLDLRGHGNSKEKITKKYTFEAIANDVLEVLNHLKITLYRYFSRNYSYPTICRNVRK